MKLKELPVAAEEVNVPPDSESISVYSWYIHPTKNATSVLALLESLVILLITTTCTCMVKEAPFLGFYTRLIALPNQLSTLESD